MLQLGLAAIENQYQYVQTFKRELRSVSTKGEINTFCEGTLGCSLTKSIKALCFQAEGWYSASAKILLEADSNII